MLLSLDGVTALTKPVNQLLDVLVPSSIQTQTYLHGAHRGLGEGAFVLNTNNVRLVVCNAVQQCLQGTWLVGNHDGQRHPSAGLQQPPLNNLCHEVHVNVAATNTSADYGTRPDFYFPGK